MGAPRQAQLITLIIEESASGMLLDSSVNAHKAKRDGHKTATLDLSACNGHSISLDVTRAAIDPSAIVSLNLSHSNLNYIPDALARLQLRRLNLSHNRFSDVPACIYSGLELLETLDLSHNALKSFEAEPKCVKKLRTLRINNNNLPNIPQWILRVHCFNLEELYYSSNEISCLSKSEFHRKASYRLRKLELRNCLARSQDVQYLKFIRSLTELDLSNEPAANRNCFARCDSIGQLLDKPQWDDRLKVLRLNNLQISFLPEEIAQLVVLEELYLSNNDLIWLPDSIMSLEKLRVLELGNNQIACLPKNMSRLKNLEVLRAPCNCISKPLDDLPSKLSVLDLYSNYLDTDCDIKIDCNIPQVDFERNFFDTVVLDGLGYVGKKNALRSTLLESRLDGPREQEYDANSGESCDCSEEDCSLDGADDVSCKAEIWEESWGDDLRDALCDNGCTLSDNEWTGHEMVNYKRKKSVPRLERHPSWMYEDA